MKKILALFFLLHTASLSAGQEIANDSISKMIRQCWDITYSHPDSAMRIAYSVLDISNKNDYDNGLFNAHNHLGILYDIKSNFDSSTAHYNQAILISKKAKDSLHLASALSNMGLTYWHIGNYYLALEYFYDALTIFEMHSPESSGMISVYNNIGMIYTELEDYDNAMLIFNKALKINEKLNDTLTQAAIYSNMGEVHKHRGETDKAYEFYEQSLSLKKEKGDNYGLSLTYTELTKLFLKQDSLDAARESLKKTFEYCELSGNKSQIAEAYLLTVALYEKKGETARPLRYSRMALNIAGEIKSHKLEYRSYKKMSELYAKQENYKRAFETYANYSRLKDSLVNRHQLSHIYDLRLTHEIDKKSHEIAFLDKLRKNQTLLIEKQNLKLQNRTFQLIIIIGLIVILALWFYVWYIMSKYKSKQKLDAARLNKKEELAGRTLQAEVNERMRISRDIHDSLGQYLGLCKLQVSRLKNNGSSKINKNTESVDSAIHMIDQSIAELRSIIHNLSPAVLHEKGLQEAIKEMADRMRQSRSIDIHLDIAGMINQLDYMTENTVYRVMQEVMNNIIKHAEAHAIDIQMIRNDEDLTIMIEDDGVGFEVDKVSKSRGLHNIYARIENIDGKVYIDSKKERGTIITIIVPIKAKKYEGT
jgi:signal transduction histidine kinase